ncbi:MAG: hypothetical protein QF768_23750, partial [Candidatus Latescibacteria bacterium]|nr:hypothetical protein [Candidatus Latescibacterota bacterium]
LLIACFTLGRLALELVPGSRPSLEDAGSTFVLCFFGGASLYGLMFVLLGWFGLIGLPAALTLTVPMVILAPSFVFPLMRQVAHKVHHELHSLRGPQLWLRALLVWCTTLAGVLIILARGLYPGQTTNDVWEHYLHYYRDVLATGSLGPHPTWYHFHVSKGAGLFYLLGSLSDELAPQLVSLCFVLSAGVVVYLITRRFTGDSSWALLGTTVFLTTYRGDFFKHHDVLTGFIAFFIWSTIEIGYRTDAARRAIAVVTAFVAFYAGFYLPMGSAILSLFWLALLLPIRHIPAWRPHLPMLGWSLVAMVVGVASALLVNYGATGLAETVPLGFFWSLADQQRFDDTFGVTGIALLLDSESDRLNLSASLTHWLFQTLRYHHLHAFFPPTMIIPGLLAAIVLTARRWPLSAARGQAYSVTVLTAFAGSALLFSLFIRNVSLSRLYAFSALLLTLVFVPLNRAIIDALCRDAIRPWARAGLLSLLAVFALGQSLWYNGNTWGVTRDMLTSFYTGKRSMAQSMLENDGLFNQNVKLSTVHQMRARLNLDARIVNLGFDPGPANSFPAPGIIYGGNHGFGPQYVDVIFGEPQAAQSILQDLQLNYFLFDLRNGIANSIAYGRLFQPEHLEQYFRVDLQSGDTYLLTWRLPGQEEPIPYRFRQVLELAQKEPLRYPNSGAFLADIDTILEVEVSLVVETAMQAGVAGRMLPVTNDPRAVERIAQATAAALSAGFGTVTLAQNRVLLQDLQRNVQTSLIGVLPDLEKAVREWMSREGISEADRLETYRLEYGRPLPDLDRAAREWISVKGSSEADLLDAYRLEFGKLLQDSVGRLATRFCTEVFNEKIAAPLTTGTANRIARIFASRENLEAILRQNR